MKKIFLLIVFITTVSFAQSFTIPSLSNHGTLQPSDLWLISSSGGAYTKLSVQAFYNTLQGFSLGYTWTSAHRHSSGLFIQSAGRLVLQSSSSPSYSGEVGVTSGYGYLRFNSATRNDTLVTNRQLNEGSNRAYGEWRFDDLGETTQSDVIHNGYEIKSVTSSTLTLSGNTNNYELTLGSPQTLSAFSVTGQVRGDVIFLINTTSNVLTLNDSGNFNLTASFAMGLDDNITLYYDGTTWCERARSDN